jgi:TetR/AcrR family transcriptional regulator, mexJK operon transcriptional repressor
MKYGRTQDEKKHKAILKAAMRLFLKRGYASTSMDAIALAARVTKQTVYSHYHNKEKLFTYMVAALCENHTPSSTLLEDSEQPIEALLYEIGLSFLNMITSNEGLAVTRLVIAEVGRQPKLAKRYYEGGTQRMIGMLADFLDRQNKKGALSIPNTVSAASYFFAMLKGSYHLRMLFAIKPIPSSSQKENHVRETVTIFMKLYGSRNPMHTRDTL